MQRRRHDPGSLARPRQRAGIQRIGGDRAAFQPPPKLLRLPA